MLMIHFSFKKTVKFAAALSHVGQYKITYAWNNFH